MDRQKLTDLLIEKFNQIEGLLSNINNDDLRQWREETLMILDHLIGEESKYYKGFEEIDYHTHVFSMMDQEGNKQRSEEAYRRGLEKAKASLQAILFGLEKGLF